MRIIVFGLIMAFSALQYKLWIGEDGVVQCLHLEHKLDIQLQENKQLIISNHALEADIEELKSGDQALEEQARFELGMIKAGEQYYQFMD